MLKFELNKFFIKQYAILFFFVVIILKLVTAFNVPNVDYGFNTNYERESYIDYMNILNGRLDDVKEELVVNAKTEMLSARNRIDDFHRRLEEGLITLKEYNEEVDSDIELLRFESVIERIFANYEVVAESPQNRYFIKSTPSVLIDDTPEFLGILLICLLTAIYFLTEHTTKMQILLRTNLNGRAKTAKIKIKILFSSIVFMGIIFSMIDFWTVTQELNLTELSYPIQSIEHFQTSPYNISILQCFLIVNALRIIGYLFVASITILLTVVSRNYVSSVFVPIATIAVWVYFFGEGSFGYYIPFSLLKGTNYLCGNLGIEITGENYTIWHFTQIPLSALISIIVGVVVFIIFVAWILNKDYKTVSIKNSSNKMIAILIVFSLSITLSGCDNEHQETAINMSFSSDNEQYSFFIDESNNKSVSAILHKTGESILVTRDVFERNIYISCIFANDNFLYYSTTDSIYQISLNNFDERMIFSNSQEPSSELKYLDLLVVKHEFSEPFVIKGFFVDGSYIYITTWNSLIRYNTKTKSTQTLIEETCNYRISFDGQDIYYLDDKYNLKVYNLGTKQTTVVTDEFWTEMILFEDCIYLSNSKGLYRMNTNTHKIEQFSEIIADFFLVKRGDMYVISGGNTQAHKIQDGQLFSFDIDLLSLQR